MYFRYLINNDGYSEVRANTYITSGEEITDHYVTPSNGTMYRRTHLRDGWFFSCRCLRCQDMTEGGTYSSAFKDFKGCGGNVLPCDPLGNFLLPKPNQPHLIPRVIKS